MSTSADSSGPVTDPTQTTTLRKRWRQDLSARVRDVRGRVRERITGQSNAFVPAAATVLAAGGGLAVLRTVGAFRRWLSGLFTARVIEETPPQAVRRGGHHTAPFVRDAYERGLKSSLAILRERDYDVADRPAAARIADDHHQRELAELYERAYYELEDAVDAAVQDATRVMADGGHIGPDGVGNQREVVDAINERIDTAHTTHIRTVAEARTVDSVNAAALAVYDEHGVEQVGIAPEADVSFQTAGDRHVCEECEAIAEKNPYTLATVPRPVLSTHPRCRCLVVAL